MFDFLNILCGAFGITAIYWDKSHFRTTLFLFSFTGRHSAAAFASASSTAFKITMDVY